MSNTTTENDDDISKMTQQYQQQQQEHTMDPSSGSTSLILSPPNQRAVILNKHLHVLLGRQELSSLDFKDENDSSTTTTTNNNNNEYATEIMEAALESLKDPTQGYDQRFGKSALKTYRSFVYPKMNQQKEEQDLDTIQLEAAAGRTARQIEFLIKRHRSHETEWIRHHDGTTTTPPINFN